MNLSEEVDLEDYIGRPDKISAADINAICQEAGMLAVRKNRYIILPKDFDNAYKVQVLFNSYNSIATSDKKDGRILILPMNTSRTD
jgi:ATP-dependent 26S proteasome regulatory subunit